MRPTRPSSLLPALGILLALLAAPALADEVTLKNGARFQGRIVVENEATLVLETASGAITFRKSEIEKVVRDAPGGGSPRGPGDPARPVDGKPRPGPARPEKRPSTGKPGQPARPKPAAKPAERPGTSAPRPAGWTPPGPQPSPEPDRPEPEPKVPDPKSPKGP
jgi:hypothetical protein